MSILIVVVLVLIFYLIQRGTFLKLENKYILTNENGKVIPAKVYSRTIQSKINGNEESIYEILVFFDESQNMGKYNPILLVPKYKMIGMIEKGKSGFIFFGNKVFQKSEKSNKFTTLDNTTFFDNPPVNRINFEEKIITFNSFEGLKKYGQNIILNNN